MGRAWLLVSALVVPVVGACESLCSQLPGAHDTTPYALQWRQLPQSLCPHQYIKRYLRKYLPVSFDLPRSMPLVWRPLNFFRRLLRAVRAFAGLNIVLFNPVPVIQPYCLHANKGLEFRLCR